jgi:hypothetical protein
MFYVAADSFFQIFGLPTHHSSEAGGWDGTRTCLVLYKNAGKRQGTKPAHSFRLLLLGPIRFSHCRFITNPVSTAMCLLVAYLVRNLVPVYE